MSSLLTEARLTKYINIYIYRLCGLQVSPGDTGWDVFSLDYHVDGPIATVTQTRRVCTYEWFAAVFIPEHVGVCVCVCASGVHQGMYGPLPACV